MDDEKRTEFKRILLDLAKSPLSMINSEEECKSFYSRFEDLYYESDDIYFRHFYSDIFLVLTQLQTENEAQSDNNVGSTQTLADNLALLTDNCENLHTDENGINIEPYLKKLNDHVSLEMARFNYFEQKYNNMEVSSNVKELNSRIDEMKQNSNEYSSQINRLKQKLNSAQQEYVAILGVFAAIILAFVGGITFSTSVLQNFDSVSIYRLLLTIDLLGLILINTINLLLKFICHILDKDKKVFFPIKWINIICFAFAALILVAWAFNLDKISNYLGNLFTK